MCSGLLGYGSAQRCSADCKGREGPITGVQKTSTSLFLGRSLNSISPTAGCRQDPFRSYCGTRGRRLFESERVLHRTAKCLVEWRSGPSCSIELLRYDRFVPQNTMIQSHIGREVRLCFVIRALKLLSEIRSRIPVTVWYI